MPMYDFNCEKCGHVFEVWQKGFDEVTQPCPNCKADAKRAISGTSFVLKGRGFHQTEYPKMFDSSNAPNALTAGGD